MRATVVHGLLAGLWAGVVRADCYAHDGVLAKNSAFYTKDFEMVSCGNGTNNCCFQGDKCGSNLLCFNSEGSTTRQYCAVSNWDGCSTLCADFAPRGGTLLVDCGKNMYCCGSVDKSCCEDDSEHYFVDPETGEVKHPSKATGASATASPTWWTVDSKALLAATSTSSTSSATDASITDASSGSTTAPITSSTPTPTNTNPSDDSGSKGLSAGAGAGIGIGAAAGVALVVGLGWWLLKRRKQQNAYEAPADQYAAGAYATEAKQNSSYYAHQSSPSGETHAAAPQELDGMALRLEMQGDSSRI